MSFLKQHKLALIILVLIIVGFIGYGSFMGEDGGSATLTQESVGSGEGEGAAIERELLSTILELRAIRLEGTIFEDPAFQSLQDFSTDIVAEPIGRPNPFAPLEARTVSGQ